MPDDATTLATDADTGPSAVLIAVLAVATGSLVANLYYAQPLIASIAPDIGVSPELAGSVSSVTQIGYGTGLFLLVSLADLVENRRLVLTMLACLTVGLLGAATSAGAVAFFAASFLIGLCATAAQILLPFVAYLVPEVRRGRIVGNVMACVLTGVMLARPVSLFVSAAVGWRGVFLLSAALMVAIALTLARTMPRHQPDRAGGYGRNLVSMIGLFRAMPALRWQSASQALMFGAFNMFWTAAPLMLADRFGLGQHQIGLFALAGAGGALAAPLAGRLADRGFGPAANIGGIALMGLGFYATQFAPGVVGLAALAILIDAGVQTTQIVSRRTIFAVPAEARGRVNAIYMTCLFAGGATGSVAGSLTYHLGGWAATAGAGGLIGAAVLALFAARARMRA